MAWHHVIPFSLLREVWNRLVDRHIETELPEARTAIRQFLRLADRTLPDPDSLIDRIRAESTAQKRTTHQRLAALNEVECHRLGTAAVWPAWNAVEGPRLRSDDPRDYYLDRFTAGVTEEESSRMRMIGLLYGQYKAFVSSGTEPCVASLRAVAQAASLARPIISFSPPIRFRPEMWVEEKGGLWRKRRDGEKYVTAARG